MDLTPQVLKDVEFRQKVRGYDPDEVDAFLEQVGTAIGQLQARLQAALQQSGSQPPSEPGRLHDPDGALQRVLLAAQETADKVVYDAESEATTMVREAEQKSSAMIAEADAHSEKVLAAAATEARRALEEARQPLLAEIEDLRSDRERLNGEVVALERYLEGERTDVVATLERIQRIMADPTSLRMDEPPVSDDGPGDAGGAVVEAAPAPEVIEPVIAETVQDPAPAEVTPPISESALPPQSEPEVELAEVAEPHDPTPTAHGGDVVVDLTAEAQPAPAMATQAAVSEEAPWAQEAEVIHGAFATAEDEARLDLVDPDGGPPTEAYMNLFDEGSGQTGDRFLDELRRAVDDEGDALGVPDEEADAAMAAFFDQDEEDPKSGRR